MSYGVIVIGKVCKNLDLHVTNLQYKDITNFSNDKLISCGLYYLQISKKID